ncbi:MAG TPA: hypothetical protein DFI01_04985 [Bacteroidales bacterium]|nr:hypothetical protein [Bacteroidales bacterium]
MPINLKLYIEDESAVKTGGFSGAVFLTYKLNLVFFEQIILPALERAGCSNVLIICDPDGYAEAMEMGLRNIVYAGLRYVCTPLPRKGNGVQHAKMLLMAGANQGRLLIGSGNLTLHGFSRNLEVFSHFEFDPKNPDMEAKQAFHSAWELLNDLSHNGYFSPVANLQLDAISDNASWLRDPPSSPDSFDVWNNFHSSLWAQFMHWREKSGLLNSPVKMLKVFSPYYDQEFGMLQKFNEALLPDKLSLYVSCENTTLNNQLLDRHWSKDFPDPQIFDIRELRENQSQRLLHGKLIIGIENAGSWCIAGSANMTRAAFENSWLHGSNLEIVTFHWSPDPTAFDYLFNEPVLLKPIEADTLNLSKLMDSSEYSGKITEDTILITELTLNNKFLAGKLNRWQTTGNKDAELVLQRSGKKYSIKINQDLRFQIPFSDVIETSESAFIRGGGIETLPCWIDIPANLREFGSHSYHERIQAKLDTVFGAEKLFHELMDFLFDRVVPDQPLSQNYRRPLQRSENDHEDEEDSESIQPPDIERFVVPERDLSGRFQIGKYTNRPYNCDIQSLRDLLSIVLLRLTLAPTVSTETKVDEDGEENQKKEIKPASTETVEGQANARQRLCAYLIDYCKKYAKRLCQKEFIEKITPEILLDNHLTLSRVLLEFKSHIIEFGADDFSRCFWLIWAPLFSPSFVGINDESTWELFAERGMEKNFTDAWNRLNISSTLVVMTSAAMGFPPSWPYGLYRPKDVSIFLAVKEMLLTINKHLAIDVDKMNNPSGFGIQTVNWDESVRIFSRILGYLPPAQERLATIIEWDSNSDDPLKQAEIIDRINKNHLTAEFELYKKNPKQIFGVLTEPDDEGLIYCPRCGGALRSEIVNEINRGKLVLCSTSSDAWLYKTAKPAELVIQL